MQPVKSLMIGAFALISMSPAAWAGPLAQLAVAYQADYLAQKNMPLNTPDAQRQKVERAIFAPAFKAIGDEINSKYQALFNAQQDYLKKLNEQNKKDKDAGLLGLSSEARKKKLAEMAASGKGGTKGAATPAVAGGQMRGGPSEVTGADGAKSVDFNGNSTNAPKKKSKDGILEF